MASQDRKVCQVLKATQDHQDFRVSQGFLDLVNQGSQDQRVIKV